MVTNITNWTSWCLFWLWHCQECHLLRYKWEKKKRNQHALCILPLCHMLSLGLLVLQFASHLPNNSCCWKTQIMSLWAFVVVDVERYDVHPWCVSLQCGSLEKLTLILKIHNNSEDLFFFLLLSSLQNFNLSCIINDKTTSKHENIQSLFITTTATRADFHRHTSNYSHIHSINLEFVAAPVSSKWE